ncbi:MAG: hypothetical protein M1825_000004 [Sarcosagium campestre]|nr:MAG: hypothetical protein M1825_000004 [Sarcosagium campestre]
MGQAPDYQLEREIAELAVQRAVLLTKRVFHDKVKGTVTKDDASPVTIGDFGAQALIAFALKKHFPTDGIIGEEVASDLRDNAELRKKVWDLVKETYLADEAAEAKLGGPIPTIDAMLDAIDAGDSEGGPSGRFWTIDPIDGTKGFLRGGQYAVCVALVDEGDVKVGVLGCPNLPVDTAKLDADYSSGQSDTGGKGVIVSASKGQGAQSRLLSDGALKPAEPISMQPLANISEATFCESVEAGHSSHGDQATIAARLGISKPSVRMDSQAKYASIARGAGDIYLRLPVTKGYTEKVWDHAPGDLIVREAGGVVSDSKGKAIDFGKGRLLTANSGFVAAPKDVHASLLDAVQAVLGSAVN